ncbi:hypothetical protein GGTG_04689 [Gaeumannomyces tritici R3-111a-1]|uniref:Uncharacterized protein n=1 Tax=Gaeumannomyces tritici (strain R3-111a-1) TaxID=644352 RepID=J3NTU0_GAET3|nr:hypothetical protein GGTG_04689 [Gaeumannomyces tritici R3-111a-1]EJT79605.1 hypothetical protein GGTG_04689 [Gaeumannomyces tritici R3-111a-1]
MRESIGTGTFTRLALQLFLVKRALYQYFSSDSLDKEKCISEVLHFAPACPSSLLAAAVFRATIEELRKTIEELRKTSQKPVSPEDGEEELRKTSQQTTPWGSVDSWPRRRLFRP